ncbi:MAG: hypothetical protein IJB67_05365 [Firmicutes bacterium]|nr:hypothetical protein [Bacillota bacterium]
MDRQEVLSLIRRIDVLYGSKKRSEEELKEYAVEWLKAVGFCTAARLNEALTLYNREGGIYAPKPNQLLKIYRELEEKQQRRSTMPEDMVLKCPFCGGMPGRNNAFVLISAEDKRRGFWGNYVNLGIPCPCRRPVEAKALRDGRKVCRKVGKRRNDGGIVYAGDLELRYVPGEGIVAKVLRGFVNEQGKMTREAAERQDGLFSAAELGDKLAAELPF